MNTQTETPIDLKNLSAQLHVSYTWFRRSFLQHTGLSPHQYHLQLKIARARKLLSDSSLTIQQTAYQAGFESEQYFCRLFKNKTGLTPGQWREQTRNS
jgi:AraC-like DNA-binding protein